MDEVWSYSSEKEPQKKSGAALPVASCFATTVPTDGTPTPRDCPMSLESHLSGIVYRTISLYNFTFDLEIVDLDMFFADVLDACYDGDDAPYCF